MPATVENYQMQVVNEETQEVEKVLHPETDSTIVIYDDDEPVINSIGGITAGSTYENSTVQQVLYDLLHPYVKPTANITGSPAAQIREKGDNVTNPTFTINVGKKSRDIKSVEIFVNNSSVGSVSSPKPGGGSETYSHTGVFSTNTTVYANVTDVDDGTTKSNTLNYTFVYPLYIGSLDSAISAPTEDDVEGMEKRIVSKSTQTYTYTIDSKRMCIACPPGWTLTKITDPNNFDVTSTFATSTVQVTGLDGTAQNYTVYLSEPTTQSSFRVTFA